MALKNQTGYGDCTRRCKIDQWGRAMTNNSAMRGERIYQYEADFTGVTDYGVAMDDILAGKINIPPQGARFDVGFAGPCTGRLSGNARGVDYLRMRADGRIDLDIRGTIETEDGHRIALSADGAAVPRPGETVVELSENVRLSTAAADYAWCNTRQIWAVGTVDLATGKIHIDGYMQ